MKMKKWGLWIGRTVNLFEIVGVILVLLMALGFQFILGELPCPLCLLQRIGFLGVAFGLLLNLKFGFRPSHYSIVLISALFASFVALRQVCLHVIPGTGAFGSAIFGLHMYTWSFIVSMLIVVSTSLVLGVDKQYLVPIRKSKLWQHYLNTLFAVMIFTLVANIISVMLVCGMNACPDNPTSNSMVIR